MNTTGKLQLIKTCEFKKIFELDQRFFPRPWSEEAWSGLHQDHHCLYLWQTNHVIGFALFIVLPQEPMAHLLKICLKEECRGQGESTLFWGALTQDLKGRGVERVYLEVESTNDRAIRFYQKMGFENLRRVKSYYSDGVDGLMLQVLL